MEKRLTRNELFDSLISKARNPFTTSEQKSDIKKILMESNTMNGLNHLFLVKCYFEEKPLFRISKEEAIKQANKAYNEHNSGIYHYLYLFSKDENPQRAKSYLLISCLYGYAKSYLEIANLYYKGILFEKNIDKAYENYKIASSCHLKEGYFGMLLIAVEKGDFNLQKEIIEKAKKDNIELPGIVE